jgi:hypothetical protein
MISYSHTNGTRVLTVIPSSSVKIPSLQTIKNISIATLGASMLMLSLLNTPSTTEHPNSNTTNSKKLTGITELGNSSSHLSITSSTRLLNPFAETDLVFSLLSDVTSLLVNKSKQLDHDFAKIVDDEFWNLLQ